MLKYSLSLMPILFLVGLLQADELEKSEVNKVYVMKDKTIICLLYTSPSPRDSR